MYKENFDLSLPLKKEQLWTPKGKAKTQSLFKEFAQYNQEPVFTLNGNASGDLINFKDLFVSLVTNDPSESVVGEVVFGDMRYWMKLREWPPIQPYLEEWRAICDVKRKQKAFEAIIAEVETRGKSAFSAAKYLIEEPWKGRTKATKEKVNRTTKEARSVFEEDVERLSEQGLLN
jgi:hypothetical protein